MNSSRKILIVHDAAAGYQELFSGFGLTLTDDLQELRVNPQGLAFVVFTGGADLDPLLYGATRHRRTVPSLRRDIAELELFDIAFDHHIPCVGICRGAQFLCVMAGGRLIQDVTGHSISHGIYCTVPGLTGNYIVTSAHHQLQYPFDLEEGKDYEVLAGSVRPLSRHYAFDAENTVLLEDATPVLRQEPDIVWYPEIQSLGVQYHPEWIPGRQAGVRLFRDLVGMFIWPHVREDDRSRKEAASAAR